MKRRIRSRILLSVALGCVCPVGASRSSEMLDRVDGWNSGLSPADREGKYCKMLESAYSFYRGTNHLFWFDFTTDCSASSTFGTVVSGSEFGDGDKTATWIQGDLHAYNFGSFDNDEGDVVYALNDFDEAYIADYQYDVLRLATSLVLIAKQNTDDEAVDVTFTYGETDDILHAFSEAYLDVVASYRGNNDEVNREFTKSNTESPLSNFLDDVEDKESRSDMLKTWTNKENGSRIFDQSLDKIGAASTAEKQAIIDNMESYGATLSGSLDYSSSYFAVKDVAKRLKAGTGSYGTPRYYVLIEGDSTDDSDDNLDDRILDLKLQQDPTPHIFAPNSNYNSSFLHAADAHAEGYKALTTNTDDYLGWMEISSGGIAPPGSYSVRERSPYKDSFPAEELDGNSSFLGMAEAWGEILATSHCMADKDFKAAFVPYSFDKHVDELTDGKHAEFRSFVRDIATSYADQVLEDYATFLEARSSSLSCSQ